MIYSAYRYEDSKGFGPFYNERKNLYNWEDDGWRSACDSIEKLNGWWNSNKQDMHLENYHIVKYLVRLDKKCVMKAKQTHIVDFKLIDVINRENIE